VEPKLIASAICSRKAFDTLTSLNVEEELSAIGKQVWKRLVAYYQRDPAAQAADSALILAALSREIPMHAEKFEAVFNNLPTDVSPSNVVDYYVSTKLSNLSLEIRGALEKSEVDKARSLMTSYDAVASGRIQETKEDDYDVAIGMSAHELVVAYKKGSEFVILPKELGDILAGLLPGDHILVYAPPEVGKSAVAINMAAGLANSGKRVLYIGNEDPKERMVSRFINRFSGLTLKEILDNPDRADAVAKKRGYDNLIFVKLSPGSLEDVKKLCLKYKPDVCIVDQLPNLRSAGKEPGKTELLEHLAYHVRMFYAEHKILGISLSQADEKAIGKMMLTIKDVYYSNIGVQGQVDVMIGVGMTHDMAATGRRYLNVVKNKAGGEHRGLMVSIDTTLSKISTL